jgi:hypothetical protein
MVMLDCNIPQGLLRHSSLSNYVKFLCSLKFKSHCDVHQELCQIVTYSSVMSDCDIFKCYVWIALFLKCHMKFLKI